MSTLCVIRGCPGSYRVKKRGEKIYYFKASEDQLEDWNRAIPGRYSITVQDRVCSRHFKDDDLLKEWNFVIDDKTVTMPRARWTLRVGAVPAIFDNYEDDPRVRMPRKSKPRLLVDYGGSSSDEEFEQPQRKRNKRSKHKRSPGDVKKSEKLVPKPDEANNAEFKSHSTPDEIPTEESFNQTTDGDWEKSCDNFVSQLSSICGPAPVRDHAKPVKRGPGRPPKAGRPVRSGRPRGALKSSPRRAERCQKASLAFQNLSSPEQHAEAEPNTDNEPENPLPDSESENSVIIEEFIASGCDETFDVEILDDPGPSSKIPSKCLPSVTIKEEKRDDGYDTYNSAANNPTDSCSVTTISEDSNGREQHTMEENEINRERVVVKREMCDCEGGDPQCCGLQANCDHTVLDLPASPVLNEEISQPSAERPISQSKNLQCPERETIRNERPSRATAMKVGVDPVSASQAVHGEPECQNEKNLEKLPRPSENQLQFEGGSDVEEDFLGFSSGEEEELVFKRRYFQNTSEIAKKSSELYFSKLRDSMRNKTQKEWRPSSSRDGQQILDKHDTSVKMALDQLDGLGSLLPVQSKKPPSDTKKSLVETGAQTTQCSKHIVNKNDTVEKSLGLDFKCDDALKYGRISDEVTVTKAPKPSQGLDKVLSVSKCSQGLEKLAPSSSNAFLAGNPNLRTYSRKSNFISKENISQSSKQDHLLKDKVANSLNHGLFKDQSTSTAENEPLKEKIPMTLSIPAMDRVSLLNGSSLDRIIQSTRSSSFLDGVTSHTPSDPTVDKTSLILKNFKSDGVLALECVVLKEQVRQLQKELFIHKQMLIDSEHNAALLQRRLELQAQLPCADCVNLRRRLIGRETLI